MRRAYTQKATIRFLKNFFCKQMAVALSIFTLDGAVQLFWAAFDMPMTVVPLRVALGLGKLDFLAFQKIIIMSHLTYTCMFIFLNAQKLFLPTLKQHLMIPLSKKNIL